MSASNKEVVQAFIEDVINQGRLERANDLVKEDFVELDPLPGQEQGREGLKAVIHALRSAFPDMRWVVREMVAEGEKVVTRFVFTGTHRGTFLGIPATGGLAGANLPARTQPTPTGKELSPDTPDRVRLRRDGRRTCIWQQSIDSENSIGDGPFVR